MSFTLSQDQQKALDGICDLFFNCAPTIHSVAVLTGSAGTGKTTVVNDLLRRIKAQSGHTVVLCASTHRAGQVLSDVVGAEVVTAHSAFKLKPGVTRYGKQVLNPGGACKIPHGSIVIIDESSMIGDQFLRAITDIVTKRALKLLFVGDPYQLAPPKDKCSLFDGSIPTFTLTQVHRQAAGNPILAKAMEFRDFIQGMVPTEPTLITELDSNGHGIHVLPHAEFVQSFVKKYVDYDPSTVVDVPMCTYTNESAINYNNLIRKATFFLDGTIEPYYIGERFVSNSIVQEAEKTILANNEIVEIVEYELNSLHGIPGYFLTVNGQFPLWKGGSTRKKVFAPLSLSAASVVLDQLKKTAIQAKNKAAWVEYYMVLNSMADLRPPFAGTTHKAQGGTFSAVFVDQQNIRKCHDPMTRARLMYVALTRARTNAYFNS